MTEKTIFDGRIDGTSKAIQEIIDLFLLENFYLPDIDFKVETENHKQIWVIYPPKKKGSPKEKIINGYVEINTPSLSNETPVNFLLVSCRRELDLLFFQLSQRVQAKFIVKDYPPGILATPWRDLVKDGLLSPLTDSAADLLLDKESNPSKDVGKYGTNRDLSESAVKILVKSCIAYQNHGGTIRAFYENMLSDTTRNRFALETLKSWVKNKKFRPKEEKSTRKSTR
jgi:hypothetical protein